jgi:O-antigen/teichoic acid export membrane protein
VAVDPAPIEPFASSRPSGLRGRLGGGGFARQVMVLMTGSGVGQGLNLLILPLLTQIFAPQDFKVLAVFSALAIVTSLGSCLGFDFALPFAKDDDDGANLLACAAASVVVVSAGVGLATLAFFVAWPGLNAKAFADYRCFVWLLPAATLTIGWTNAFEYWSTYRKRFRLIANCRIGQVIVGGGVQIFLGLAGSGSIGLLSGYVLMGAAALAILAAVTWVRDRQLLTRVLAGRMRQVASAYRSFPRFTAVESVASASSLYLPVLIISAALPGPEAGFLSQAMRLVQSPLFLISRSVSQVYLSRARESAGAGRLTDDTAKVLRTLIGLTAGPLAAAAILAPHLAPVILGRAWRPAGIYLAWITPWAFLQFLSVAVLTTMYALGQNARIMWLTLFGLVLRTGLVGATAMVARPLLIASYAASGAAFYGLSLAVFMAANGVRLRDILPRRRLALASLAGCPLAATALVLAWP